MTLTFKIWDSVRQKYWCNDSLSDDGNPVYLAFFNGGIGWGLYDSGLGNRIVSGENEGNRIEIKIKEEK